MEKPELASLTTPSETIVAEVAALLTQVLALRPDVARQLSRTTRLLGNLPELDSMAVATVLTAIEDRFGILIDDDEVSGALFETVGSLADFVASKQQR
jgi:acyl carrier protein